METVRLMSVGTSLQVKGGGGKGLMETKGYPYPFDLTKNELPIEAMFTKEKERLSMGILELEAFMKIPGENGDMYFKILAKESNIGLKTGKLSDDDLEKVRELVKENPYKYPSREYVLETHGWYLPAECDQEPKMKFIAFDTDGDIQGFLDKNEDILKRDGNIEDVNVKFGDMEIKVFRKNDFSIEKDTFEKAIIYARDKKEGMEAYSEKKVSIASLIAERDHATEIEQGKLKR